MKQHTYLYLTKSIYANQVFEIYMQRTGCSYNFKVLDENTKRLLISNIADENIRLFGSTWEDIAYQLNGIMNTEDFKKVHRFRDKYDLEQLEHMKVKRRQRA